VGEERGAWGGETRGEDVDSDDVVMTWLCL